MHTITFKNYSVRQACELLQLNRGTFAYKTIKSDDSEIIDVVKRIAESKLRWGFGKIMEWLKYHQYSWNHKRVRRIYCTLKLNHRIKPTTQPRTQAINRTRTTKPYLVYGFYDR